MFSLKVGIHCDGCVLAIKKNVEKMEGVDDIMVDKEEETVVITGNVHPDKVIAMLYKKLNKRAVLLLPPKASGSVVPANRGTSRAVSANRGKDSQIVVPQSSPNAVNNLLGDPNTAVQVIGELRRKIPGLRSVEISTQAVTNTLKFSFDR